MKVEAAERPRLLIVAGPNGAGKTTITEAGLAHQWFAGCEYVNPDEIAQREFADWNDPATALKAAQLVLRASSGKIVRQYEPVRPWMEPVAAALSTLQNPA